MFGSMLIGKLKRFPAMKAGKMGGGIIWDYRDCSSAWQIDVDCPPNV